MSEETDPAITDGASDGRSRRSVAPKTIRGRVVAGVLLIIPVLVTFFLVRYVYAAALAIGTHLVYWVARAGIWALKLEQAPPKFNPVDATWYESLLAVVLTVIMLYLLGWLGTNAVGRRLIEWVELILQRVPFVDTVYSAVKRMVQALSGTGAGSAPDQRVVLIDFPNDGMMALAFMTNVIKDENTGKSYATVFVPTAPNPTSGYMELVPLENITPTDMSVEAGLSMILSGGASAPPNISFLARGMKIPRSNAPAAEEEKSAPTM